MPREIIEAYDGTEVGFEHIKPLSSGGARVEFDVEGGPRWRVDVSNAGDYEIVTSWNANDELADVETPDWMDDLVAQLQHA